MRLASALMIALLPLTPAPSPTTAKSGQWGEARTILSPRPLVQPAPPIPNPFTLPITPTLLATPDAIAPFTITFDGVYSLPLEIRRAVLAVLEPDADRLPAPRLTVSAYRAADEWAKITLVPSEVVERGWTHIETIDPFVVEVIAFRTGAGWIGVGWRTDGLESASLAAVRDRIPPAFIDFSPPTAAEAAESDIYSFPWRAGDEWWAVQGWHGGNAIDFQPTTGARAGVLAAAPGYLRELCSDGTQSFLQIRHVDGRATYYLHVTLSLNVRRQLLDQQVVRGQYLGDLIRYAPFVTPCGQGYSRHLHFAVTDPAMVIDSYTVEAIAAVASCCAAPPRFASSNVRVDANDG